MYTRTFDFKNEGFQLWCARGVENNVDPDQLTSQKPADLHLHCFQKRVLNSKVLLIWFDSPHPTQHFFSHIGTGLPGFTQY